MLLDVCEMCGDIKKKLHKHHIIPRFLRGEEIIKVCPRCHVKAEGRFLKLLLDPFGESGYGITPKEDPKVVSRRQREYFKKSYYRKLVCFYVIEKPNVVYWDRLYYNNKTSNFYVSHTWTINHKSRLYFGEKENCLNNI